MQLALYKAPGTFLDKLIRIVTRSKYSHCELVIDGICYSSSIRDGGVRAKQINLDSNSWDIFEVSGDKIWAIDWFTNNIGKPYDLLGAITSVLPITFSTNDKFFCSEACALMLGKEKPHKQQPHTLI